MVPKPGRVAMVVVTLFLGGVPSLGGLQAQVSEPDLVIASLAPVPANPSAGESVQFRANVTNEGAADASNFTVAFVLDGNVSMGSVMVSGLAPGNQTTVWSAFWTATSGNHTIRVFADANGTVAETNETNNEAQRNFIVAADRPDLRIRQFSYPGENPPEPVVFTAIVGNDGNVSSGSFSVRFLVSGGNETLRHVEGLGPGAEILLESDPWTPVPGWHNIRITVDVFAEVDEYNEGNNEIYVGFPIAPPPPESAGDLVVEILGVRREPVRTDLGDARPHPLGRRFVDVGVSNVGASPLPWGSVGVAASSSTRGVAFPTYDFVGSTSINDLQPGERRILEFTWDPIGAAGDVTFEAGGWASGEERFDNNADRYEDFVLLGGFGGVIVRCTPLPWC